jgi:phenylpropionate dioxygenase-like ring-hydroxylating dioxygenase large terminal subunit
MDTNFFLRDIWYYGLPGKQLKPGQMLAKKILGEPILFCRSRQGKVFALRDICPHRGIPLSYGRFDGNQVECAYHGWRFNETGSCTLIPALTEDQTLDLGRFCVKVYPVQEAQGNIWIYIPAEKTKAATPAFDPPQVPGFSTPYQSVVTMPFPCFVDHAVVGLMDPAHVPFVHRAWWWRADPTLMEEVKTFDPSLYGFTMRRHRLERQTLMYRLIGAETEVEISFQLPGVRFESVIAEKHRLVNLTAITPIDETLTEVTTLFYTTLPWFNAVQPLLMPVVKTFLNQDRDMVVKQQDGLKYDPVLMLIKDADAQARWYYQLKLEYNRAIAEQRSFVNPVKEKVLRWRS